MTKSLQELLLSIATGGPVSLLNAGGRPARVHDGARSLRCEACGEAPSRTHTTECGVRRWSRVPVEAELLPGQHPGLWEELQTTIARLSKTASGSAVGAHSAETPVPYHRRASLAAARLGGEVSTWARLIAEENTHLTLTATTVPAAARWLACFPTLLAEHPAHDEMLAAVQRVVRDAERVIDRAPDKVYAGPCQEELDGSDERCQGQLYAMPGQQTVRCRDCGARHEVEVRQEWMSRVLGDQLVTAAEAAPVLAWLAGKRVTPNNIAAWKRDGRVAVHEGRWPYRFGDLLALARQMKTRKSKGAEGSAA